MQKRAENTGCVVILECDVEANLLKTGCHGCREGAVDKVHSLYLTRTPKEGGEIIFRLNRDCKENVYKSYDQLKKNKLN